MKKILDYEEMLEALANLDRKVIEEQPPIGTTRFGEPIRHYTYGKGQEHVILTAGTHSVELITNIFLIRFMENLSNKSIHIDEKKYTIHFIPIVNPEGTIIVTSAIRTLIKKDTNELDEQIKCISYYLNSRIDDGYAIEKNNKDDKIIHRMFQYGTKDCIDSKYAALKENVEKIIDENNLPKNCLINWGSNGSGVDLNSNLGLGEYYEKFREGQDNFASLRLNQINRFKLGPTGCPSIKKEFVLEKENEALKKFYEELSLSNRVIGSIIFHSCGNIVYYLDFMKEKNYWNKSFGPREIIYNRNVASLYSDITGYKMDIPYTYTTFCGELRSILPGTLVVELGPLRSTPLSQFIDIEIEELKILDRGELSKLNKSYSNTYKTNEQALISIFDKMSSENEKYRYSVLVNKDNYFDENIFDLDLVDCNSPIGKDRLLERAAFTSWCKLQKEAKEKGFIIEVESAYRSKKYQEQVLKKIEQEKGKEYASLYVAKPGYSEHQTGLALDFCLKKDDKYLFDQDLIGEDVLEFVHSNIAKYGFILRYPKDKKDITGYDYEPWHIRYVGIELAKKLYEENKTLEEYYAEIEEYYYDNYVK